MAFKANKRTISQVCPQSKHKQDIFLQRKGREWKNRIFYPEVLENYGVCVSYCGLKAVVKSPPEFDVRAAGAI